MRVDVLITGMPPESQIRMTRTVLQNITVLSAGTNTQTDSTGKPMQASSVTLLVSPAQAETLTLAGSEARIQLVLRNGADQTTEKTDGANLAALYGAGGRPRPAEGDARRARAPVARPEPVQMAVRTLPPPPPPPEQIVSIRGTKKEVETVSPVKRPQ
jgi:pilus assembly protein CpaB